MGSWDLYKNIKIFLSDIILVVYYYFDPKSYTTLCPLMYIFASKTDP